MDILAKLRADAQGIFQAALEAVDPYVLVKKAVRKVADGLTVGGREIRLSRQSRLIVIGAGKAAAPMAAAIEEILADRLSAGAVVVKYGHGLPLTKIRLMEAGHPLPDENTLRGTRMIFDLLQGLTSDDLVLMLLSGGGSALFELPANGISLADLQQVNSILLACGATIEEINAVRKHLSQVKGGQLLRFTHPAQVVTLALSDVIGDRPEAIASGPTVPDSTTFSDVSKIFVKYDITDILPKVILEYIGEGISGRISDTPKPGDPIFDRSIFQIVGNNRLLLDAALRHAESLGYQTRILTDCLQGEARDQGRGLAEVLKKAKVAGRPICLLAGGETTVALRGSGLGGRNQELALAAAIDLDGSLNNLVLSAGSDGTDGPTDAAGAIADGTTLTRATALGLDATDYLERNDTHYFFKPLHDLLITGATLTNVMDLVIMLKA